MNMNNHAIHHSISPLRPTCRAVGTLRDRLMPEGTRSGWSEIQWNDVQGSVHRRQRAIRSAFLDGDARRGRRLQRLFVESLDARLLAVRRVAEKNAGAKSPGVDGVANLSSEEKLRLAHAIELDGCSDDVLVRPGPEKASGGRRTLLIPTMRDRAKQTLLRFALVPQLGLTIPQGVYGGLRGAGLHDAYVDIVDLLGRSPKYVARTDIADFFESTTWETVDGCFTSPDHFRAQIRAWMTAPAVEPGVGRWRRNSLSQGGPISPLLANLVVAEPICAARNAMHSAAQGSGSALCYVDDVVLIHADGEAVLRGIRTLEEKLGDLGLGVSQAKTRGASHETLDSSLESDTADGGFVFLGARFFHFPTDPEVEDVYRYVEEYGRTEDLERHLEEDRFVGPEGIPERTYEVNVEPIYEAGALDDGYGFIDIRRFNDRKGVVKM